MAAREHPWSTMVSMLSWPRLLGSPVMRSIATWEKGGLSFGTVILYRGVFVLCVRFLFCWQIAHPLTYCSTQARPPGQQKRLRTFLAVSSRPGWAASPKQRSEEHTSELQSRSDLV